MASASSASSSSTSPFSQDLLQYHATIQRKKLDDLVSQFRDLLSSSRRDLTLGNIPVICQDVVIFVDEHAGEFAGVLNHTVDSKLKKRLALSLIGELFPTLSKDNLTIVDNLINLIVSLEKKKTEPTEPKRPKTIFGSLSRQGGKKRIDGH